MENASKALIMAGEMLIGILIISLAVYMFTQFGNYSKTVNDKISESQITQFNVHFTAYEARANISAQEIASAINFANQSNTNYDAKKGDDYFVDVCIDGTSVLLKDINEFLKDNMNNTFYSCNCEYHIKSIDDANQKIIMNKLQGKDNNDIQYNRYTQLVTKINFHTINNSDYANALLKGYNIEIK